jgi:zinc and cadmium transporter
VTDLAWILAAGIAMAALALVGAVALLLPEAQFRRLTPRLVGFAAGSLVGGAFFHMLPEAVDTLGNELSVYVLVVAGFVTFLVLEQYLHWHHCHRAVNNHRPLGYLILIADGAHNLLGGLAVAGAFLSDVRLGIVTWLVAAAHEVPQELGDFGILIHAGWSRGRALLFNVASASTFLLGGVATWALADTIEVAFLLPFAAGNFMYIGAADLVPQMTTPVEAAEKGMLTAAFAVGAGLLLLIALLV